ncbi:hypothetical protein B9479_004905 [Cryptococcus floricola]|uniref:CCHC-type domain-containing protein n=1 Tax=Cryptococcus floricola TaxID=2591691 RepID=A0A5D3AV63_9TREE|nr:hypothetical protein B9479_004905 [Cryptococcus floricola]
MSEAHYKGIPILRGRENYEPWSTAVQTRLAEKDAKLVLKSLEREPCRRSAEGLEGAALNIVHPPGELAGDSFPPEGARRPSLLSEAELKEKWREWAVKEKKARGLVTMTVSETMRGNFGNYWSSAEIWKYLEALHKPDPVTQAPMKSIELYKQLLPANASATTMMRHFEKFTKILNELDQLGFPMPQEEKIQVFFMSLGNNYNHIRGRFVSRPAHEMTWVNLARLYHAETDMVLTTEQQKAGNEQLNLAMSGGESRRGSGSGRGGRRNRGRGRGGKRGSASYHEQRGTDDRKCFNCHKKGHLMRNCPEKRGQSSGQVNTVRSGQGTDGGEGGSWCMFSVQKANKMQAGTFIVDTGATQNGTYQREYLLDIVPLESPLYLYMPNGTRLEAKEKGDIEVGGKRIHNVYHVPGSHANLLSHTHIEEDGFIVDFRKLALHYGEELVGKLRKTREGLPVLDIPAPQRINSLSGPGPVTSHSGTT